MNKAVAFPSDALSLAGTFTTADRASGKLAGLVLAHGFAGARYPAMEAHFAKLGYGVLGFDFRGYGKSEGERGVVLPRQQVTDIRSAVGWLAGRPEIDADRIGVVGSSLGGAVAIMAAALDSRIKACVAGCPLAKGDSTLRMLYKTEPEYAAFMNVVQEKRRKNERLARFDIVYIPENLRSAMPPGAPMEFTADTVDGFLSLNPLDVVSRLAPRPLFIIAAEDDHVVPVADSHALAARAGQNCDLEILEQGDHFIFALPAVIEKIGSWLVRKFPPI
jgi:uncharacterized protein